MGSRPSSFTFTTMGPLRLYSTAELLRLPPPQWLIHNILPEGALGTIYGPPETFKSFIAIDVGLCVATGLPWHGHEVQQGLVLYVAAEGGPGISKRVRAWLLAHGLDPADPQIAWLIESLSIHSDSDDIDALMKRLDDEVQQAPRLIIIDTMARCFEGDENQQEDMGRFIAGLDRLRKEYGAALLAIHHTRIDGNRERGSSSFRGGLDTMMSVERIDNAVTLSCAKQKDSEHFADMTFQLKTVEDSDSCVITQETASSQQDERMDRVREVLGAGQPMTWDDWFSSTGLPKGTFFRYFNKLRGTGQIIKKNSEWSLFSSAAE